MRVAKGCEQGLSPYDFKSRADDLATADVRPLLKAAGADAAADDDLQTRSRPSRRRPPL